MSLEKSKTGKRGAERAGSTEFRLRSMLRSKSLRGTSKSFMAKMMKKCEFLFFLEMLRESSEKRLGELAGLRRAPGVLTPLTKGKEVFIEEVHKECFAQTVDGAPSIAPSSVNFSDSKNRPAGEK